MDEHKKELLKNLPKIDEMMLLLGKGRGHRRDAAGAGEGGVPVRRGSAPRPDLGR